jgi:hypothetical protein
MVALPRVTLNSKENLLFLFYYLNIFSPWPGNHKILLSHIDCQLIDKMIYFVCNVDDFGY